MSDEKPLSYEEARDQLVDVVRQLESGSVPLSRMPRFMQSCIAC